MSRFLDYEARKLWYLKFLCSVVTVQLSYKTKNFVYSLRDGTKNIYLFPPESR